MGKAQIGYFTTGSKIKNLFGYFTEFVNSFFSHQCLFVYLPPSQKGSEEISNHNMSLGSLAFDMVILQKIFDVINHSEHNHEN
jgi:hypothetical protein